MAHRPDTICAGGCGRLLWTGSTSSEHPVCQPCRASIGTLTCEKCGDEFRARKTGNTKTGIPRFCSRKCFADFQRTGRSRVHSRRRKAVVASTWDGVTDEQIWERDGWACKIPGCELGPIRQDLKWPDRLSPTVDHIVPLSRGGTDIAPNKRAAHAFCNMSKHNKMHPDDVQIVTPELAPLGLLPMRERVKVTWLCIVCMRVPVKREDAPCRTCYQSARTAARDVMRKQALAMRERGIAWKQIASALRLSGPGAAYNVAYPPDWHAYQYAERDPVQSLKPAPVELVSDEPVQVEPASGRPALTFRQFWTLLEQGKLRFTGHA